MKRFQVVDAIDLVKGATFYFPKDEKKAVWEVTRIAVSEHSRVECKKKMARECKSITAQTKVVFLRMPENE